MITYKFSQIHFLTGSRSARQKINSCDEIAKAGFEALSQLALLDILAALPMEHVASMTRLGHERLRQTFSLKWVADRMSDVTSEVAVYVY